MGSIKGWLVTLPVARAIGWKRGRRRGREIVCYLLLRGVVVVAPRCTACAVEFGAPRRDGERFRVALEVFEPPATDRVNVSTTRLFVGRKVLVARTAGALQSLLDRSISYVGPRVMVAVLGGRGAERLPALFCTRCAEAIATHVTASNERYYAWDWLVDFEPRRMIARLLGRIHRKPRDLPFLSARPLSADPLALPLAT
jgi:hypothetical protein